MLHPPPELEWGRTVFACASTRVASVSVCVVRQSSLWLSYCYLWKKQLEFEKKNPTLPLNGVIDGKSLQFPSSSYHSLLLSQLSSLLSGDDPSEVNPSLILHGASLTILSLFVIEVRSSVLNSPCMHYSSRVCVSNEHTANIQQQPFWMVQYIAASSHAQEPESETEYKGLKFSHAL